MILFENAVWIHVPKTAGSSFEQMCKERHGIDIYGGQHNTAVDIPEAHLHKPIFGFMRDPLISECSNWRYHYFSWQCEAMTFENWCEWRFGSRNEDFGSVMGLQPHQTKYGYLFNTRPAAGYFTDESSKCQASKIYRYEELGDALKEISDMLGMDCSIEGFQAMEYAWGRGREKYSKHITPRAEYLVRQAKAIDFNLFEEPGDIPTDYEWPNPGRYAYTRNIKLSNDSIL